MGELRGFLDPNTLTSNGLLIAALAGGWLLYTRAFRLGRVLVVCCLTLLVILGYSPVGNMIRWSLESRFPTSDVSGQTALDGIIVLTGSSERPRMAAELARLHPETRIVISGGHLSGFGDTEADAAATIMERLGIPRARIEVEGRARTTAESASILKAQIQPKPGERWLLVTTALHMPRSIGAFRQAGFAVEAFPVERRIADHERFYRSPNLVRGLRGFDVGMYECIGLLVYWLTGRSSELLPAPAPKRGDRF